MEPLVLQPVGSELQEYYDSEVNRGRLYTNLNALVDEGLVKKDQHDRRTNAYTLIEAGEQVLRDRREWKDQYVDI